MGIYATNSVWVVWLIVGATRKSKKCRGKACKYNKYVYVW